MHLEAGTVGDWRKGGLGCESGGKVCSYIHIPETTSSQGCPNVQGEAVNLFIMAISFYQKS